MDETNLIARYWKETQDVFDTNLTTLQKQADKEATHDLRVAIKKLRAYFHLYTLLSGTGEDWLKDTESLFQVTGRQRDVEICMDLLSAYSKEHRYRFRELNEYFSDMLKKTKAWSVLAVKSYPTEELQKIADLVKHDPCLEDPQQLKREIRTIIDKKIAEVKHHFSRPHKVRQLLKEVYYWLTLLQTADAEEEYHAKDLHKILDELGNWQDYEVFLKRARHFKKDFLPASTDEYRHIKNMQETLTDENSKRVRSAMSRVKRWMKKINRDVAPA